MSSEAIADSAFLELINLGANYWSPIDVLKYANGNTHDVESEENANKREEKNPDSVSVEEIIVQSIQEQAKKRKTPLHMTCYNCGDNIKTAQSCNTICTRDFFKYTGVKTTNCAYGKSCHMIHARSGDDIIGSFFETKNGEINEVIDWNSQPNGNLKTSILGYITDEEFVKINKTIHCCTRPKDIKQFVSKSNVRFG